MHGWAGLRLVNSKLIRSISSLRPGSSWLREIQSQIKLRGLEDVSDPVAVQ